MKKLLHGFGAALTILGVLLLCLGGGMLTMGLFLTFILLIVKLLGLLKISVLLALSPLGAVMAAMSLGIALPIVGILLTDTFKGRNQ